MRSAGSPTTSAVSAPAAPAPRMHRKKSRSVFSEQVAGEQAADTGDGELAEADVAAPAGEQHQRHPDHRPHDGDGGEQLVRRTPGVGHDHEQEADDGAAAPHLTYLTSGRWRSSRGTGLTMPSEVKLALSEFMARDSDARCRSRAMRITARKNMVVIDGVPRAVPADELVEHAEADAGEERHGQRLEPGDDGRGQRRQQHGRSGRHDARRDARRRRLQHVGEGGEAAGDHPDDAAELVDGDAEQQGAVLVLGRGADGDAGVGLEQEPGQAGDDGGDDGDDEDLVAGHRLDAALEGDAGGRGGS